MDIGFDGFTLGYNDQENLTRQLSAQFKMTILADQSVHIRLFSGADKIIQAWAGCMQDRGGPAARFVPQGNNPSSNDIILDLIYYRSSVEKGSEQRPLTLSSSISIPKEIKITGGNVECLKKGYRFAGSSG